MAALWNDRRIRPHLRQRQHNMSQTVVEPCQKLEFSAIFAVLLTNSRAAADPSCSTVQGKRTGRFVAIAGHRSRHY